jgi:hypothetical protein
MRSIKSARLKTRTGLVRLEEKCFDDQIFYYADQEFLDIFSFPLISGDITTALSEPYSVILTKEAALRLFGNEKPVGQTISFNYNAELSHNYVITGVFEALPKNSHLSFDYLASFSTLKDWLTIDVYRNLLFRPGRRGMRLTEAAPLPRLSVAGYSYSSLSSAAIRATCSKTGPGGGFVAANFNPR